jgi:hypothetical protein
LFSHQRYNNNLYNLRLSIVLNIFCSEPRTILSLPNGPQAPTCHRWVLSPSTQMRTRHFSTKLTIMRLGHQKKPPSPCPQVGSSSKMGREGHTSSTTGPKRRPGKTREEQGWGVGGSEMETKQVAAGARLRSSSGSSIGGWRGQPL